MAVGASMKTWMSKIPSASIFTTSENVLCFGQSPFPVNLNGILSGWKELCSTKVTLAPLPPPCFKWSAVSEIPIGAPYPTSNRHKFPNPQPTDFGVLLKARSSAYKLHFSHPPSPQIYDQALTKNLKPTVTATFVGILARES